MKDNQCEQLFTDLTPEAAAVVEGGGSFSSNINFDSYLSTRSFYVRPGGSIALLSRTKSSRDNLFFNAAVRNVNTGNSTPPKSVRVGNGIITRWTGMRGGTYKIDLTDTKDNIYVSGRIGVGYS
jgi:hypothetical protein